MKKSIIAGAGVAALGLAVLPFAGVFAAATPAGDITDTLNVNIPAGCTIVNNNSTTGGNGSAPHLTNSYTVEMHNGELRTDIGGTADQTSGTTADNSIDVSCNTGAGAGAEAGWKLTAVGAGAGANNNDLYNANATDQIVAGTATSGPTSNWAFKIATASGASYATGYSNAYAAVPSTEADIVTGSGSLANAFTITYQVYVDQTQDTGTYTGAVKYTLYNPAS
ncbi:hypothetical protein J6V85_01510 [Candidatus Saccharibacteria bacterium]|nr:hypothetical protein [Candidatus Saccharibacteria bacterium]